LTKGDDETFGPFPMTQSIPYLGTFYSNYYISVNGWMGFDGRQIYPNNDDLETNNIGDIFYRALNSADLEIVETDINIIDTEFNPSSGLVVTWNAPKFGQLAPLFTFQLIVVSNGDQTYLIFNYDDQTTPIQSGQGGYGGPNNIGYGNNNVNFFDGGSSIIMGSASNVNVSGKWIFKVDSAPTTKASTRK